MLLNLIGKKINVQDVLVGGKFYILCFGVGTWDHAFRGMFVDRSTILVWPIMHVFETTTFEELISYEIEKNCEKMIMDLQVVECLRPILPWVRNRKEMIEREQRRLRRIVEINFHCYY